MTVKKGRGHFYARIIKMFLSLVRAEEYKSLLKSMVTLTLDVFRMFQAHLHHTTNGCHQNPRSRS
jgi:hypothetical protein